MDGGWGMQLVSIGTEDLCVTFTGDIVLWFSRGGQVEGEEVEPGCV
jgi:hypothetical protein